MPGEILIKCKVWLVKIWNNYTKIVVCQRVAKFEVLVPSSWTFKCLPMGSLVIDKNICEEGLRDKILL